MSDDFEDHCWKDVITPDVLEIYSAYRRKMFVGASPALLAVDLYEVVYRGGARPPAELPRPIPAPAANTPTRRSSRPSGCSRPRAPPACRCSIRPAMCAPRARPSFVTATKRNKPPLDAADFAIRPEFKPQPQDVVITKQRASVFFGTPLIAHLTQLGVQTLIICGESTSGCVRATAVDAYSHGFHVVLVEECCFDRSILSHKVNLFDMHHKYVDVMHVDEVVAHLERRRRAQGELTIR